MYLVKLAFKVTGIDGSQERISKAKSDFPHIDFYCNKINSKLPFDDDTFDVIFSNSVFQYLEHSSVLKECKRVLKQD